MTRVEIRVGHDHHGLIFWLVVWPVVLVWLVLKWTVIGLVALCSLSYRAASLWLAQREDRHPAPHPDFPLEDS